METSCTSPEKQLGAELLGAYCYLKILLFGAPMI